MCHTEPLVLLQEKEKGRHLLSSIERFSDQQLPTLLLSPHRRPRFGFPVGSWTHRPHSPPPPAHINVFGVFNRSYQNRFSTSWCTRSWSTCCPPSCLPSCTGAAPQGRLRSQSQSFEMMMWALTFSVQWLLFLGWEELKTTSWNVTGEQSQVLNHTTLSFCTPVKENRELVNKWWITYMSFKNNLCVMSPV